MNEIQLAVYSYYDKFTKERTGLEFFKDGKEISQERYKDEYDDLNSTKKETPPLHQQTINTQQSCPSNCPDCGEPYNTEGAYQIKEQDSESPHPVECECIECLSAEIINKCLYFVLNTDAPDENRAKMIYNACMAMREVGYSEAELDQEDQYDSEVGDTYNISVIVENNKNISKTVGNIVNELKKTKKNSSKQNSNVSEDK